MLFLMILHPCRCTLFPYTTLFRSGVLEDNPDDGDPQTTDDGMPTPLDFSDDVINLDSGIGFYASLDNIRMTPVWTPITAVTSRASDDSYLNLQLSHLTATLIGIDG